MIEQAEAGGLRAGTDFPGYSQGQGNNWHFRQIVPWFSSDSRATCVFFVQA
jgi:hypothetical protein